MANYCDVIVLCSNLSSYKTVVQNIKTELTANKILTDVGSVKSKTSDEVFEVLGNELSEIFVPAHPIAGKEKSGFKEASADLYRNKKVILCDTKYKDENKYNIVSDLWKSAGGNVERITTELHDKIYCKVSHFIQLLSFATKKYIKPEKGLEDFCRLQNSPEEMWQEIFFYNNKNLLAEINLFEENFNKFAFEKDNITNVGSTSKNIFTACIISKIISDNTEEFHKKYAGTGFKSITSLAAQFNSLKAPAEVVKESLNQVSSIIDELKKSTISRNV